MQKEGSSDTSKEKEEKGISLEKEKEKDTTDSREVDSKEVDSKEMRTKEKAKGKESATTVARPGTWQEAAHNRSKRAKEKEKGNHSMDGVITATSKGIWQETAEVEKEG